MERTFLLLAGVTGFLAVALGAFGAHALRARLAPDLLAIYQTGVQYHLVHAVALLACALCAARWPSAWTHAAGWLFLAGIAIFSGTLYALALSGVRALGAITPLGGLCFLGGWLALAVAAWRAA
jgi:uncharacterized membrane protein YgdD (TMEM256/DUF423 family)